MVHRRQVKGKEIVLGNQGDLFSNAMTWWDHDTGSVWSQPLGQAIAGPRKGLRLEQLPSEVTLWADWSSSHPQTLALDVDAGASGFDLDELAIVLDFGKETVAFPVPEVRGAGVANDVVAGVEVAVVVSGDSWRVFSRRTDDGVVRLEMRDGMLRDAHSGSTYHPLTGQARAGPHRGAVLGRLPAFTSFPRDFWRFWPEGRLWREPQ